MATTLDTGGIADSAGADHGPATSTSGDDTTRRTGHDTWSTRVRRPRALAAIVAVLALVVGGALWLVTRSGGSGAGASTTTQQIVTVTRGDVGSAVSAEGTIAAAQTDNLNFGSSGQVTAVNVKAGQQVTAGQVLATINSASLASSLSSAQANLATAQAKLSDDEASGASSDQINADQTSVQSATDSVSNAQQSLAGASLVATFNGTVAQVNVSVGEQLTGSGTGATTQTGTGTGSGQSSASLGSGSSGSFGGGASGGGAGGGGGSGSSSSSSSSSPAVQVISQGQYSVSLSVGTSDISRVAVGQPATLTVTTSSQTGGRGLFAQLFGGGAGRATAGGSGTGTGSGNGSASSAATGSTGPSATGSVTSVSAVATASSGVASYPVVVTFNADSNSFYPGATVTGSITTQAKNDVIEVPTRAISTQNGASVVTVSTNGKVGGPTETRTVTTGITAGGNTEITSGLKVGEHVVITLPSFFGGGSTGGAGGRTFGGGGGAGSGAGGGTFGGSGGAGRGGNATSGSGSGG